MATKAKTKKKPAAKGAAGGGEKLVPIPRPSGKSKARTTTAAAKVVARLSDNSLPDDAPNDAPAAVLSHITADLRPLAVSVASISFDPRNAMLHPENNMAAIQGSLRRYGQRKPVVVNRRTGHVEAGNGTLAAALTLGWEHIAVVWVDDDPETATGFAIADNRSAQLAKFDDARLVELMDDIRDSESGKWQMGDDRLDAMMEDLRSTAKLREVIDNANKIAGDGEEDDADTGDGDGSGDGAGTVAQQPTTCPSCGHQWHKRESL